MGRACEAERIYSRKPLPKAVQFPQKRMLPQEGTVGGGDEMTIDERRKYLKTMRGRDWAADRTGRSTLLPAIEVLTRLHRKSLTRLLAAPSLAPATPAATGADLWGRSAAGGVDGLGKPGLHWCRWCRAAYPRPAAGGAVFGHVRGVPVVPLARLWAIPSVYAGGSGRLLVVLDGAAHGPASPAMLTSAASADSLSPSACAAAKPGSPIAARMLASVRV